MLNLNLQAIGHTLYCSAEKVEAKLFCVWKTIYAFRCGKYSLEKQTNDFKKGILKQY